MTTKPILFSTPMVAAINSGHKTQTRRIIKSKHESGLFQVCKDLNGNVTSIDSLDWDECELDQTNDIQPKVSVGESFYVRETWRICGWCFEEGYVNIQYKDGSTETFYPETDDFDVWLIRKIDKLEDQDCIERDPENEERFVFVEGKELWEPSIFMPKWACRIFLEVTNVRVERLQDISEDDCIAEGVRYWADEDDTDLLDAIFKNYETGERNLVSGYSSFRTLWISINGEDSWDNNPWVWVYDFKKTEKPKNFI